MKILFILYQYLWSMAIPLLLRSPRLREGAAQRLLHEISFSRVDIWIHAASVGEANIAGEIINSLSREKHFRFLVTTNTRQGKEILEKKLTGSNHEISIAYMVFDQPSLVRRAVSIARPQLLVLIELEIWPGLLKEMKMINIPILIANGRITEKSFKGYMKTALLWRHLQPDRILAISEADRTRFLQLFRQEQTFHVPNIKFDVIGEPATGEIRLPHDRQSLVLASIRRQEENDVLKIIIALLSHFPELHIELFPRHLHRVRNWEQLLAEQDITYTVKSRSDRQDASVTIWDVFGHLLPAYQRADAAFVGGSLADLGGQNFIEAFMNGVVPVTGPSTFNFLWAGDEVFTEGLVQKGADRKEVTELLKRNIEHPADRKAVINKAGIYIRNHQGGTGKTCLHMLDMLNHNK